MLADWFEDLLTGNLELSSKFGFIAVWLICIFHNAGVLVSMITTRKMKVKMCKLGKLTIGISMTL